MEDKIVVGFLLRYAIHNYGLTLHKIRALAREEKMGERYWITGAQLGLMKFEKVREKIIEEVIDKQFIANFVTDEAKKWFNEQIDDINKNAQARTTD